MTQVGILSSNFSVDSMEIKYGFYNTSTSTTDSSTTVFTSTDIIFSSATFKPDVEYDDKQFNGSIDGKIYVMTGRKLTGSLTMVIKEEILSYNTTTGVRVSIADFLTAFVEYPNECKIKFIQDVQTTTDGDNKNAVVEIDSSNATYVANVKWTVGDWEAKGGGMIEFQISFEAPWECVSIETVNAFT